MRKTEDKIVGEIIVTDDKIVKVSKYDKGCYVGYDIITEKLVGIPVNSKLMVLPSWVVTLLKQEELRVKLAYQLTGNSTDFAKMIGMSDRNGFRKLKNYDISVD